MGRIVRPNTATVTGDGYLDRVAKYVPVEIVAAFLATNKLFTAPADWKWAGGVFAFCWLLTPIYIWRVAKKGEPWRTHAAVSTLAFPVWALAIGGVFFEHYQTWPDFLPSVALILFSLVAGLIAPPPEPPDPPAVEA